ncbi:DUF4097 family beta strand repeat-containing protein [Amycolatopsis suaedae]|uniref:DUF4097 domain-containing protein n=1 Tax=Amycolatopsis suaedae TaxID=2510978 RepID=A0A4Q7J323_9PSEU|nr:DUF4097 family beta strand repeat-containing protein [Amycolatopsis suaedae]RZQ61337.1 hypothetical protein EWH70_23330 [Amycolatopsis suaedae]
MPTFATTGPVTVSLAIASGDVRVVAGARDEAVAEIRPRNAASADDATLAENSRVDFSGDTLSISVPKPPTSWRNFIGFDYPAVDIVVEVPEGSRLRGKVSAGDLTSDGRLGEVRLEAGYGGVRLDATGSLHLNCSYGDVVVNSTSGHSDITTASGTVRVATIDGTAVVRNSNGDITLGEVSGDLRVKQANGDIVVDRTRATVVAKSAYGDVVLREIVSGDVVLETSSGDIEIGIPRGTAAWIDSHTDFGSMHNSLTTNDGPAENTEKANVRARTAYGDIRLTRS